MRNVIAITRNSRILRRILRSPGSRRSRSGKDIRYWARLMTLAQRLDRKLARVLSWRWLLTTIAFSMPYQTINLRQTSKPTSNIVSTHIANGLTSALIDPLGNLQTIPGYSRSRISEKAKRIIAVNFGTSSALATSTSEKAGACTWPVDYLLLSKSAFSFPMTSAKSQVFNNCFRRLAYLWEFSLEH